MSNASIDGQGMGELEDIDMTQDDVVNVIRLEREKATEKKNSRADPRRGD
jgi:hypothetical protein